MKLQELEGRTNIHERCREKNTTNKKSSSKRRNAKAGNSSIYWPDISGAKQYTVFNNGLPDVLKKKIQEQPFFRSLIVLVEKLAQANMELAKEGSVLNILYQKASKK
ncbi:MAG: hypothetical protein HFH64_03910 [Lachnospiraceae bacterium]|nr:hypothetical protein [Lachnospiraceae bacterium]